MKCPKCKSIYRGYRYCTVAAAPSPGKPGRIWSEELEVKRYEKIRVYRGNKRVFGVTLRQIRAIRDFGGVRLGDVGGWIEKEENLSQDGDAWVYGDARVCGDAQVYGDAWVYGDAQVCGDAWVYGDAQVYGGKWKKSPCYIQGSRWVIHPSSLNTVRCGCQDHTWQEWHDRYREISAEHGGDDVLEEYILYFNLLCSLYGHEECRIGGTT